MPVETQDKRWKCAYCNNVYNAEYLCYIHEKNEHGLCYVPLLAEDIDSLVKFIYTKDDRFVKERYLKTLKLVLKKYVINKNKREEIV